MACRTRPRRRRRQKRKDKTRQQVGGAIGPIALGLAKAILPSMLSTIGGALRNNHRYRSLKDFRKNSPYAMAL